MESAIYCDFFFNGIEEIYIYFKMIFFLCCFICSCDDLTMTDLCFHITLPVYNLFLLFLCVKEENVSHF